MKSPEGLEIGKVYKFHTKNGMYRRKLIGTNNGFFIVTESKKNKMEYLNIFNVILIQED